jgi:hypothetical protein
MQDQGLFSPWAEGAADLLGQALAAGLAEGGVPFDDGGEVSGFGFECGVASELAGVRPLCSKLPPDWGVAQQLQSVQAAWQDMVHFEEQLSSTYCGWSDQQWADAIESQLLSGEAFQACSLQQHADIWSAYAQLAGIASLPVVSKVLSWVHEGYPLHFVDPFSEQQQLHPKFEQRLARARRALAGVVPAHLVELYLQGGAPHPVVFANNTSCADHPEFVRSELQEFVSVGALEVADTSKLPGLVVHPMSVAQHPVTGKLRLCVDANYVNIFEPYESVQFELLSDVFPLVQPGDFGFVTDCTKGYLHVPLHPSAQRYLCVAFEGITYMFKALPFGLSSAVKAFTDLMTVAYLPMRRQGFRFSFMIDDRIGLAATRAACWLHIYTTVRVLCALGFHLGLKKCVLWPCQLLQYLGMLLALDRMQCMVPDQKLQRFMQAVEEAVRAEVVTPRLLARVAGMLVSFAVAVPLGKLYTRQLFWALSGKTSWDEAMPVGADLRQHLVWLASYVSAHNGQRWFKRRPGVVLVSDASVKGVGGFAATVTGTQVTLQSQLPEQLFVASSTCREAAGMFSLLQALLLHPEWKSRLEHRTVKVLTDNQGVAADMQGMKGCQSVYSYVAKMYELAAAHDVDLVVEWRPRESEPLQYADLHSKFVDVGDWGVSRAVYVKLCDQWQVQPVVDWFARPWSAKCDVFYSQFLMPGAAGVDAFDHCWALPNGQSSYICPPQMLVAKVLDKVLHDRATCVLILPAWYKSWHGLLKLLPVQADSRLPASVVEWGDRAPQVGDRSTAMLAGLRAYKVVF